MSKLKTQKRKGGGKKIGRNKRSVDVTTSAYVKGKISFAEYEKRKRGSRP